MNVTISESESWAEVDPNFIYNRVDLYNPRNAVLLKISGGTDCIYVPLEICRHKAIIAAWGMRIPYWTIQKIAEYIFSKYANIFVCFIRRAVIPDYPGDTTNVRNDYFINLPNSENELDARLSAKGRYNIRREKRIVEEKFGECVLKEVQSDSDKGISLTRIFFELKEKTYGSHYSMSERDYISKYHVSNIYYMAFGNDIASIMMSCEQADGVYLENLTFNPKYSNYSPGQISYDCYLKTLIGKKKQMLFLLGGEYGYKQRYGSIETPKSYKLYSKPNNS